MLTSNQLNASYQWLDCSTMLPIAGAISQSFTATANGYYAVIVSNNACVDTSFCYTISNVGVVLNDFGNKLSIYPNPTDGNFNIDLGSIYESISIQFTDLNGKLIEEVSFENKQLLNLEIQEESGVYLLHINTDSKKAVFKLIKE